MVDSRGRKIGGTAGTVVTTAIGVYLQGTVHPRLAMGLYIVAGVLCLFTAVQWTWIQRLLGIYHDPTPPLSGTAPAASASVHAPIHFAPVINNNNQTGDRIAVNGELLDGRKLIPLTVPEVATTLFSPLQIEAFQLAKDMRDFLKELGPRPLVPVDAYKNSSDSVFEHIKAQYALDHKWSEKLTNGYSGRFADRVRAMKYKFGELGLHANIPDTNTVYQADTMSSIANEIAHLATQIEEQ